MEDTKKFAEDFKPVFSASKLAEICSPNSRESTKIKFLRSFRPFSEIKLDMNVSPAKKAASSPLYKPKIGLTEAERDAIKKELDESLNHKELKFDDEHIIEAFEERLLKTSEDESFLFLMNKLVLTDDTSSSPESAYLTAQSDEECFRNYCNKSVSIETKSKQAVRYISNMRGRKMEKSILERINETHEGYDFVQNKSKKYVDYGNFKIVGIIDGLSRPKRTVLEIKTRKNFDGLGNTMTRRERLQAMTYMNMFECEKCLFIESGPNGEIKQTIIDYDDVAFKREVLDCLNEFTLFARGLDKNVFKELLIRYNIC